MPLLILASLIALPLMLVLDFVWIGFIANSFYRTQMGLLYTTHVIWQAAAVFYLIYIIGLAYFVLIPGIKSHSLRKTVSESALFALVAFATYDLTALSVIAGWPVILSVVDMAWGVFEATTVSGLTYLIATKVFKR